MTMYFSQWCGLCQEALNPRRLYWSVTWELGHLEISAALYVSCGMFPNNIEHIYNLKKLHRLLFHFCQQNTFFTQYFNHNSDCKQCPGNVVLLSIWTIVSVQTHYFNSCSQIFQMFLAFNPFTPESDQCQISPAASPEILHHTVRRTWLFIAYSDERWL